MDCDPAGWRSLATETEPGARRERWDVASAFRVRNLSPPDFADLEP